MVKLQNQAYHSLQKLTNKPMKRLTKMSQQKQCGRKETLIENTSYHRYSAIQMISKTYSGYLP